MKTQLPKFEGRGVQAATLKLTGRSDERVGSLALDEEVYLIIRGVVRKIAHSDDSGIFTRSHEVKASVAIIIERDQGERILDEAAMLADERFGIQNLFNIEDAEADNGSGEAPPPEEP
jgi:hypothetical protein